MIKGNLQHLCWKTYELMMERAADQKFANGGGGVPWGIGLPLSVAEGGVREKSLIVVNSTEQLEPPAEEGKNVLKNYSLEPAASFWLTL